jgi:hypothetical protein
VGVDGGSGGCGPVQATSKRLEAHFKKRFGAAHGKEIRTAVAAAEATLKASKQTELETAVASMNQRHAADKGEALAKQEAFLRRTLAAAHASEKVNALERARSEVRNRCFAVRLFLCSSVRLFV